MAAEPELAPVIRAIGEPCRLRMLTLLMDGRALTAKELAYGARVSPATATSHLAKLTAANLIGSRRQGRHKYFQLASPQVAHCVEALLVLAPATRPVPVGTPHPLREARFCYDHLAGRLAVMMTEALEARRIIRRREGEYLATAQGASWLQAHDIDVGALRRSRRQFAPLCMDWSERRPHVGGALGAALAAHFLQQRWIRRRPESRAVVVTPAGQAALRRLLGIGPA